MDVHRSRFVPFPTFPISALAFSRAGDEDHNGCAPALKLAIGRSDGSIELWNPQKGRWVQESVLPGNDQSIDALLWTHDIDEIAADGASIAGQCRLFSISSSAAIAEWDMSSGMVKRQSTGNFSEVWCFAAQPRTSSSAQEIVAGCGDGNLVLFATADDDLQFKRTLARVSGKNARCMCITYQTRDRVVAGFADSMIRVYDTRNGSLLRNLSLGAARPGAPRTAMVWQVRCLPNGDIVSGDSNGDLGIWDGKTYSLSQRIAGHDSDCLDLVTSSDGRQIFSGSIDGRVAIYRQTTDGGRTTWAKNSHRKLHGGEVKAMAAFDGSDMSVLVSGGGDIAPCVTPVRGYGKENVRRLPSLPQHSPLVSAPKARLLVSWWGKTLSIWHVARQSQTAMPTTHQRPHRLVARIHMDSKSRIRTAAISEDGKLLAAASGDVVKVFQLRQKPELDHLAIRRLAVPDELSSDGAQLLEFSQDGKWLFAATPKSDIYVARLVRHSTKPKQIQVLHSVVELDRLHRPAEFSSSFRGYERAVIRATFSSDSRMLVVGDIGGHLDSWILQGDEDSSAAAVASNKGNVNNSSSDSDSDSADDDDIQVFFGQRWVENRHSHLLPRLQAMPLVLTFRPSEPAFKDVGSSLNAVHTKVNGNASDQILHAPQYRLWVLTALHDMLEFDMLTGRLSEWSRRNNTASLPSEFSKMNDRAMGALWDVSAEHERLWLYGSSFVCMIDAGQDLEQDPSQMSRKRNETTDGETYKRRKLETGASAAISSSPARGQEVTMNGESGGAQVALVVSGTEMAQLPEEGPNGRKWWCSYRYSPVLGIVRIQDEATKESGEPMEVVLVERPLEIT